MSTTKNEHNPDNLTPEQVCEGWRLLTKGEVQEIGDEWWYGGEWCPVHQDNVGRHYEFTTTRRRITPPTNTTGSGREGEPYKNDPVKRADYWKERYELEHSQVEALRRDGEQSAEWSELLPEESGYWWHWSGHEDDAPFMHYIMWSGTVNKYFVSANTIPETPWVEDVGGYWIKATVPRAAIDSTQRQEKP